VEHVIEHLAGTCVDGWLDAYDYYEAVADLKNARDCLQHASRQTAEASTPLLERSLSVYERLGDIREFDTYAKLADRYKKTGQFQELSRITRRIAATLEAGRKLERRGQVLQVAQIWDGHEGRADELDANALAGLYKALGGMASDRKKWEQIAKKRNRSR